MDKKKILFIDDDEDYLEILVERFSAYGFECHGEKDIQRALESLNYLRPDIVILDLSFKNGFDGIDFLSCYKQKIDHGQYAPPIIVLSSLDQSETISFAMDMGAHGYMAKPFEPKTLLNMIQDYMFEKSGRNTSHDARLT